VGWPRGATDEIGFHAVEHRHYVTDIYAAILGQLGLDSRKPEVPGRKAPRRRSRRTDQRNRARRLIHAAKPPGPWEGPFEGPLWCLAGREAPERNWAMNRGVPNRRVLRVRRKIGLRRGTWLTIAFSAVPTTNDFAGLDRGGHNDYNYWRHQRDVDRNDEPLDPPKQKSRCEINLKSRAGNAG
jgi:hypothetical protein